MSTPTIRGVQRPIYQETEISFDPQRGRVVKQEWAGAGDSLAGLASDLEGRGISYTWRYNARSSRLTAQSSGAMGGVAEQVVVDSWQLLANELHTSVKENPVIQALGITEIGLVQADADAVLRNEEIDDAYYLEAGHEVSNHLLDLLVRGQTHYAIGQYVLKHTANVSDDFTGLTSAEGEGSIYTTSQLQSEIGSGWTYNCPARLRTKIGNIGIAGDFHSGYMWGWRKLPSTETSSANNRVDISYEYWWGQWSTYLYPAL